MTRNLKVLGLLAFAVLAISAMFASAAQAGTKGILTGGETPATHENVTIVGTQYGSEAENYFEAFKERVTCDEAIYRGTLKEGGTNGNGKSLTVTPEYKGCLAGGHPATVTMNGCDYIFTQVETAEDVPEGSFTGKADLTCPHENKIIIHVYAFGSSTNGTHFGNVCTINVWPKGAVTETGGETKHRQQTLGGHLVYTPKVTEATGFDDLTVKATATEITASSNCPGGGETGEAVFNSTVTAKALEDEGGSHTEERDLWISE